MTATDTPEQSTDTANGADAAGAEFADDAGNAQITARVGGRELFRYHYRPPLDPFECPAPYFHPLRTLGGGLVTTHRPNDHRWHKGLAMTVSHLSEQNFWGGVTYVHGAENGGYVRLPNVGRLVHREFGPRPETKPETTDKAASAAFTESVDWISAEGERWIAEDRGVAVHAANVEESYWTLQFDTALHNVSGRVLEIGSPTVFGRLLAGYSGLFWRGPRSFAGGRVLAGGGLEGPEVMGQRAPWLAYTGEFDEIDGHATLVFRAAPDTPGGEPCWFVRNDPFAAVNPSLAFFEGLDLAQDDTLSRSYRVTIADGVWDRERIEAHLREQTW
jgi:hypothetical protein